MLKNIIAVLHCNKWIFKEVICIYACFSPKMENCAVLQNFSCQKVLVTWWYAMVWNYSDKMSLECFMILPRDNCMVSCDGFGLLRRLPHMNLDRVVPCCDELIWKFDTELVSKKYFCLAHIKQAQEQLHLTFVTSEVTQHNHLTKKLGHSDNK